MRKAARCGRGGSAASPALAARAFAGRCEACGLAEPDHAASVNGRAAEPINSMGGAPSQCVWRDSARVSGRLEDAGSTMAGNCTCSAFLDGSPRASVPTRPEDCSTQGYAPARNNEPDYATSIARISPYFRNHQSPLSCGDEQQNWLKPRRLAPSLVSRCDTRWELPSLMSGAQHLHTIALCPNGLSAAVRRPDSSPSAPLPTP